MRAPGIFVGFLNGTVICLIWLMEHTVDSVQLSAPARVTAEDGGSVTVSCQYDRRFKENTKYWCKGQVYELCSIVVKTPKNRPNNRSFIADNAGFFNVTMTSLRKSDEGKYWCVIARSGRNVYTGVTLLVNHTVLTPTSTPTYTTFIPRQDEMRWWVTLRWILFILMLCCLVATHIIAWRIHTPQKIGQQQKSDCQISNIYD